LDLNWLTSGVPCRICCLPPKTPGLRAGIIHSNNG
jgi:hypothetical protein